MKMRIFKNSIRLRLSQSEVGEIAHARTVESSTDFGNGRLVCRLEPNDAADTPTARFSDGVVTVTIPGAEAAEWANSDLVGISSVQSLNGDGKLQILIEKDFACMKPRDGGDDSDTFPNPNMSDVS